MHLHAEVDSRPRKEIPLLYLNMETGKKLLELVEKESPKDINEYTGDKVLQLYFPSLDTQDPHGVFMDSSSRFKFLNKKADAPAMLLHDDIRQFEFMGRNNVREVYALLTDASDLKNKVLASGGSGNGKSYILAALAAFFMAQGDRKVIYIPDCKRLNNRNYRPTLIRAILMTHHKWKQDEIENLLDEDRCTDSNFLSRIKRYITSRYTISAPSSDSQSSQGGSEVVGPPPLFIVDQYDELKNEDHQDDITSFCQDSCCLFSMSANCPPGTDGAILRGFNRTPDFRGGFALVSSLLSCFI